MNLSADKPISFAIIGCGLIGKKRAAALAKVPGARVVVCCDLDLARSAELAKSIPGCRSTADFKDAIADPAVDAVVVATLNASLAPIALFAVGAGKHALIEKPGGISSQELRALKEKAAQTGALVRVGYNHRFHPALSKAREIVDSGALGPLMFLRGRYGHGGRKGYDREWRADPKLSGGGELIDQGVHLIDLASWFLGEFTTVEGHAATFYWDMKVDDNGFMSLRTKSGQTAWLHVSCSEWKNLFSFEIYGREGKLAIDGLGGSYGLERLAFYRMLPQMGPPETTIWEYPSGDNSWADETAAFAEDISKKRPPSPGLAESIKTLEIVETIYKRSGFPTT